MCEVESAVARCYLSKGYEQRRRLDKIDDRDESNEGKSRMEGVQRTRELQAFHLPHYLFHSIMCVCMLMYLCVCLCVSVCVLSVTKLPFRSLLPPWYWPPA